MNTSSFTLITTVGSILDRSRVQQGRHPMQPHWSYNARDGAGSLPEVDAAARDEWIPLHHTALHPVVVTIYRWRDRSRPFLVFVNDCCRRRRLSVRSLCRGRTDKVCPRSTRNNFVRLHLNSFTFFFSS